MSGVSGKGCRVQTLPQSSKTGVKVLRKDVSFDDSFETIYAKNSYHIIKKVE
jgi:hypothetical protein